MSRNYLQGFWLFFCSKAHTYTQRGTKKRSSRGESLSCSNWNMTGGQRRLEKMKHQDTHQRKLIGILHQRITEKKNKNTSFPGKEMRGNKDLKLLCAARLQLNCWTPASEEEDTGIICQQGLHMRHAGMSFGKG